MAALPEQLGALTLVREIGSGLHCRIWEATEQSGAVVAVKVVDPEMARDAGQRRLLEHEFRVASDFAHPGLIRIDRFGEAGGLPHLVMELFPHSNLKHQVAEGPDSLAPRLQRIAFETAMALDHMHGRGWVHRDVKPDNILAAPDGKVKLIDFAIAGRKPGLLGGLFGGGQPAQGSPSYMAPEQIRGHRVDPRADIYSLGCTLFELVTGQVPYSATTTNDLLNKHVSAPIPSVTVSRPTFPSAAARLIRRMMAKDPAGRPASMQEVLREVRCLRA
ncbi:MAG: serine/threonine-protein kinase [Planctomycetia bacterium]